MLRLRDLLRWRQQRGAVGNSASLRCADLRALPPPPPPELEAPPPPPSELEAPPPPRWPSPELETPHELGDGGGGRCLELRAEALIAAGSSAGQRDWGAAAGRPLCVCARRDEDEWRGGAAVRAGAASCWSRLERHTCRRRVAVLGHPGALPTRVCGGRLKITLTCGSHT
jgi:hypothetical protein